MLRVNTFRRLLLEASTQYGNESFLVGDEQLGDITYSELRQFASGLESHLNRLQIPISAPIATLFHNCGLAALLFLGIISARRVLVPLNPNSARSEIEYMLEKAQCAAIIGDPSHANLSSFGNRQTLFVSDHRAFFLEHSASGAPISDESTENNPADFIGEVVFTSGSTGRPKGVMLSERNLLANATSLANVYRLRNTDRFLTVCPLFHNSGQVFTTLACALVGGSTAAIKSDVGMLHFWSYVQKYRANWSLGMVSFLALLLTQREPPASMDFMRGLLTGGSAIDASLIQRFESRFGVPVRTVYGLTETSSISTCEFDDPNPRSFGSSGRPLPTCNVGIGSEPGSLTCSEDPKSRELGEIWISGPNVFARYVDDPELTRERKYGDWLRTGDVGYFDERGNLFVIDRLDSMLIVGGENVYPAEVERLCGELSDAAQIVLVGVDHPIWGKELVLTYKTQSGAKPSISSWHHVFLEHVSPFKVPQRYVAIQDLGLEDFPRKHNGKLDRVAIAAQLSSMPRKRA